MSGLVIFYFFRQTVLSLITIWGNSRTYSYGFVIVPICCLLVLRRKEDLKELQPTTSFTGLAFVVISVLLWLAGDIADVQLLQQIALVALVDSLVWTFLGLPIVKVLAFPLSFLLFAIPVGDSLVPHLQSWTANFTVNALNLSGIPTVQDGFVLSTPTGSWQVAAACSGIRYLLASVVIGTLVAGIAYQSWKRRILFLIFSALLPIVANAIRAYGIVVLAYVSGNAIAAGVDHVVYGFLFFSLLTGLLVFAAMRSYEPEVNTARHSFPVHAPQSSSLVRMVAALCAVIALSVTATAVGRFVWHRPSASVVSDSVRIPAGWSSEVDNEDQDWTPDPSSAQSKTVRSFISGTEEISLCIIRYSEGPRGVELINSRNVVSRAGTWTVLSNGKREASINGKQLKVAEYVVSNGPQRRVVWLWYSVGDTLTSDPYRLRMVQTRNRLLGLPDPTLAFAASTLVHDEFDPGDVLAGFLK